MKIGPLQPIGWRDIENFTKFKAAQVVHWLVAIFRYHIIVRIFRIIRVAFTNTIAFIVFVQTSAIRVCHQKVACQAEAAQRSQHGDAAQLEMPHLIPFLIAMHYALSCNIQRRKLSQTCTKSMFLKWRFPNATHIPFPRNTICWAACCWKNSGPNGQAICQYASTQDSCWRSELIWLELHSLCSFNSGKILASFLIPYQLLT